MAELERNGVKLHYEVAGSGPAVLLTHGFASSSAMWRGQAEAFGDRYRVITWDMRGHGDTDSPDDFGLYSEAETVADIAAILDACGESSAVIGGLSLGGYMSLAFYLAHPERTDALMLLDTGPGYNNPKGREGWNEFAIGRAKGFEERGLESLPDSAEVNAATHRSADGLAKAARGMLTQVDARVIESLPNVAVPALVLVGAEDKQFLAATSYMTEKIPNAKSVTIPDAGHAVNLHQPAAFNAAVGEFLGSLSPR